MILKNAKSQNDILQKNYCARSSCY